MQNTSIEWTDATWNPLRGCTRVSEGCRNCYAEKVAFRFSGPGQAYEGLVRINAKGERVPQWNGQVHFVEKHLLDPLKWKPVLLRDGTEYPGSGSTITEPPFRPRRIFVNSMSDLFHESVPDEWIDRIFAVMALAPQHTFQILTKRPERMLKYLRMVEEEKDIQRWINAAYDIVPNLSPCAAGAMESAGWPLPNVWLGVSTENQKAADERIPLLLQAPAAIHFLSMEPLLGLIDLEAVPPVNAETLDWVIVGGESGPGARPMHPDWARSLRDQCVTAKVPFFFKQWGEWQNGSEYRSRIQPKVLNRVVLNDGRVMSESISEATPDDEKRWPEFRGHIMARVGKKAAGRILDGREWREFPEVK